MGRSHCRAKRRHTLLIRLYVFVLILLLTTALLAQTAFAKTYVISDGDRVVTYTTFATDPAQVLGQAGVALAELDTYTTGRDGETITVRRAVNVTVVYHGEAMTVSSQGETAGELLSRLNLEVGGCDVTSHALDEAVTDGMELRVDRVRVSEEVYTATVPHETTYCTDSTLPAGTEEVLVEGRDGELLCTAQVTYVNGVETERTLLSQTQITAPVTEIVASGTAVETETATGLTVGDGYIRLESGEVLTYTHTTQIEATAYTHTDAGCDMITYTGTTVHRGTVAVDPRYIPYGTRMFIVSNDGAYVYGISVAEDCGGDIKGDRMDLYFPSFSECIQFGRRDCTVYFLG